MNAFPDLEAFLRTLRAEGLTVGPREIVWLQHTFHQAPKLDRERLQIMLGCVLAKTLAQRRRFDALFELWLGKISDSAAGRALLTRIETKSSTSRKEHTKQGPTPEPQTRKPRTRRREAIAALLEVGVLLFLIQFFIYQPYRTQQTPPVIEMPRKPQPETVATQPEQALRFFVFAPDHSRHTLR